MKDIKTFLLTLSLIFVSNFIFAQTIFNINGTVNDANGIPVPNCPITIKGDSNTLFIAANTFTDANGQYSLNLDFGNALSGYVYAYPTDSCIQSGDYRVSFNYNSSSYTGSKTLDFMLCATDTCSVSFTKNKVNETFYDFIGVPKGTPPFSYHWNQDDGSPVYTKHHHPTYFHIFATSGTTTTTLTLTDGKGRTSTYSDMTSVTTNNNLITFDITEDTLSGASYYNGYFFTPPFVSYSGRYLTKTANEYIYSGTTSTPANPTFYGGHGFSGISKMAYICLSVENSNGDNATSCKSAYLDFNSETLVLEAKESPTNTSNHFFYGSIKGTGPFTFSWDFGDGNTDTSPIAYHSYTNAGVYNVCVTATDSAGKVATDCISVTSQGGGVQPCAADFSVQTSEDTTQFFATAIGGLAPFTYQWDFGDNTSDSISNPIHIYDSIGVYNVCLTITDSLGCSAVLCKNVNIFYNAIFGNIYNDTNSNCLLDPNENNLGNSFIQLVNINTGDTTYATTTYTPTNSTGDFKLRLDNGTYELTAMPLSPYWQSCAPQTVTLTGTDTVHLDLGLQPIVNCSNLHVNLSSPTLVYCYDETYEVNYCNLGTQAEPNTYIEVTLDSFLTVNTTSIPYTQSGNIYTFQIGNVNVNECGSFTIDFTVDCAASLGQIHCSEVNIFPNQICLSNGGSWSGATIIAKAQCEPNDSVRFTLENIGASDMTQSRQYFVIEDQILQLVKPFKLDAGEDTTWVMAANLGAMYFLQAEQEITHPLGNNMPTAVSYNCSNTSINPHLINQYGLGDGFSFQDVDCQQNVYSFDPNDKQGFPTGYGDAFHYITKNDEIEYMIRFQNTGTFTAFNVVIKDEIDMEVLDLASVRVQGSSHSYQMSIVDGNVLKFSFNDIMLPDSTSNEPESHGFIRFKIAQKMNNPIGTVINNTAAIYFDFNEPVITNMTYHTVGENFTTIVSSTFSPNSTDQAERKIEVFPNPFLDKTTFEITSESQEYKNLELIIIDVTGRQIRRVQSNETNRIDLERNGLVSGIYFYQILSEGQLLDSGKLIAR